MAIPDPRHPGPRRVARRTVSLIALLAACLGSPTDALALSWTADRTLTGGGSSWSYPGSLAISSSTSAHMAYEQAVWGAWTVFHRRTTDSGNTWSTPFQLSSQSIGVAGGPVVDASGSSVNAAWTEGDSLYQLTDAVVVHRRSTDNGLTWSSPQTLSPTTESAGYARLARSGSTVVVTWTNHLTGTAYVRVSKDGGATWAARKALVTTTNKPYSTSDNIVQRKVLEAFAVPAIGSGVLYVAFMSASKTLRIRRSIDGGATWKSATTVSSSAESAAPPSVAATGSNAIVGYGVRLTNDGYTAIRVSKDKGATWAIQKALSAASANWSGSPVLAVQGSRWMAIFERCTSSTCAQSHVYYRASTNVGGTWSSAIAASVRKRSWASPGDVGVATKTLVLYVDYNGSANDVYVRQGS